MGWHHEQLEPGAGTSRSSGALALADLSEPGAPVPAGAPAPLVRSRGLDLFRLNPFRLLRLSLDASPEDAVWRSEAAIALAKIGEPQPVPAVPPWLPDADEIDLRRAADAIEEPLQRLLDQLLWFDFGTGHGPRLYQQLLTAEPSAWTSYAELPTLPATTEVQGEAGALVMEEHINAANLQLLLGFSALHGLGPGPLPGPSLERAAGATLAWQTVSGVALVRDAHAVADQGLAATWAESLTRGLQRWSALLADGRFTQRLRVLLAARRDEAVAASAADEETLRMALSARLVDAICDEMKLALMNGRFDHARALLACAKASGFERRDWSAPLRGVRAQLARELSELDALLQSEDSPFAMLEQYSSRLAALAERWRQLDADGLLGTAESIDRGVLRVFERTRNLGAPSVENRARLQAILERMNELAHSDSLRERLSAYRATLDEYWLWTVCVFCRVRAKDPAVPAMLLGKKVVSTEWVFNGIRTQYSLRGVPLPRCSACNDLHDFQRKLALGYCAAGTLAGSGLSWLVWDPDGYNFAPVVWFVAAGLCGGVAAQATFQLRSRRHCPTPNLKSLKAAEGFLRDGYSLSLNTSRKALQQGAQGAFDLGGFLVRYWRFVLVVVCIAVGSLGGC